MNSIRVIGVGSPSGDDQVGWHVVRSLAHQPLPSTVTLLELDRPGASLLRYLEGMDAVVLVDALRAGFEAGSVLSLTREDLLTESRIWSSHQLGVAEALALGEALDLLPTRLALIGIEADPSQTSLKQLSLPVQAAIPQAVAKLSSLLAEWSQATSSPSPTIPVLTDRQ
ncbi:hydrogenase maturation protease [Mangrovitalea sediminis]|uniref:hydrogenase maturation protease n=1 Tax=Mangrovitalea sediminis TaxID=1982043 RepID=UPI000BE5C752|nr:hydrogenase maturation protease [Mangrovitalea sediminis]